jgi:hypothetical protein
LWCRGRIVNDSICKFGVNTKATTQQPGCDGPWFEEGQQVEAVPLISSGIIAGLDAR